jgi:hypothetical protein
LSGCHKDAESKQTGGKATTSGQTAKRDKTPAVATPPPPPMQDPVPLWEHGRTQRNVDAATSGLNHQLIYDLGEAWTPYLFMDGPVAVEGKATSSAYRPTYLALARGEFPDNLHGERAKDDKYLELYGILPTLHLVRERMRAISKLACVKELDLTPLQTFNGVSTYTSNPIARGEAKTYASVKARTLALMKQQEVAAPEAIDTTDLPKRDHDSVTRYLAMTPEWLAIEAMQQRMKCEGYYAGKGKYLKGVIDWATHEALAEFERRHRVFSWGFIGKDSLVPLRMQPMDAEREAVLRVLTERAIHTAGVLEDGSTSTLANGSARTFTGADGKAHPIPNLTASLREDVIDAFGLQTPESTLAWLESLGELPKDQHRYVAIKMVPLPEYYGAEMQLTLDYDRGDVWYDFPFNDKGEERPQPVQRRPQVTVSTYYNGKKIALARYGTTIGGWRTEMVNGVSMWKYKNSSVGPRAWEEIIAGPVWLPPDGTPPEALLVRNRKRKHPNEPEYLVNYHETGPSYASAYGLVAAYHRTFFRKADGTVVLGNDEGIRTHGSVDYMSIMRRHSHGCHRLHNHIALRLMSFVLAHRPHDRMGQEPASFKKQLVYKDLTYMVDIKQGGYLFKLKTPLFVNVEEGRIRGQVKAPITTAIPKYEPEIGAYVMPDGSTVRVRGSQLILLTPPTIIAPIAEGAPVAAMPASASGSATSSFSAPHTATVPFGQGTRGVSTAAGQASRVAPQVPQPSRIAPVSVRSTTATAR